MKYIGTYELGYENVDLYLMDGRGGSLRFTPDEKALPRIALGGAYSDWQDIYTVLMHEAMEFALTRGGCRYGDSQDLSNDTGAFVFFLTHTQFADVCSKATEFMVACHKDLHKAWIKYKIKHKMKSRAMVTVAPVSTTIEEYSFRDFTSGPSADTS